MFAKKDLSFMRNFPLRKHNIFQQAMPLKAMEESSKRCSTHFLQKRHLLPNDMVSLHVGKGNIPVPCFSIYIHFFSMQNSCQKVQYPMHRRIIP